MYPKAKWLFGILLIVVLSSFVGAMMLVVFFARRGSAKSLEKELES